MEQKIAPTRIQCPECEAVYRVARSPLELSQMRVKCKKCGATFKPAFPDLNAPAAEAPPAPEAPPQAPQAASPAPQAATAPPPAATAPPPAALPSEADDSFDELEENVGGFSRSIYEVRQKSPDAIPGEVSVQVSQIADALIPRHLARGQRLGLSDQSEVHGCGRRHQGQAGPLYSGPHHPINGIAEAPGRRVDYRRTASDQLRT